MPSPQRGCVSDHRADHRFPCEPVSDAPPAAAPSELNPLVNILAIGCGLIVVAGSFGPWVTAHVRFLGSMR